MKKKVFSIDSVTLTFLHFLFGCLSTRDLYLQRWFTLLKAEMMQCWSQQTLPCKAVGVKSETISTQKSNLTFSRDGLHQKDSTYARFMKASSKRCSVAAWGNIHSCTGSDGLYIFGSSRCFFWTNRRTATTMSRRTKELHRRKLKPRQQQIKRKDAHTVWLAGHHRRPRSQVKATEQLNGLLLFQWEGLHHAAGGEHELSNQPHWGGHQSEWKGGCCLRGSGSWLSQLWGVDDTSPRISQSFSNTFPIIPVIYCSDL